MRENNERSWKIRFAIIMFVLAVVIFLARYLIFGDGEEIIATFKGIRDGVVFTNKRIVAVNVQGLTGTKKDFSSLPYSKIQAFSVETAGVFDLDSELEIWFSGLGKVNFEFVSNANVSQICKMISEKVL